MAKHVPNELHPALLSTAALNPFQANTSASRGYMYSSSHLGQMLVIKGSTERRIQTGMEREYGKYTFRVEMPCDGKILDIIERYPPVYGQGAIEHNPQTIVIYENAHTKEVGIINLVDYCSNHQYFGFKYVQKPGFAMLRKGADIPQGTVFLDSPSVSPDGGYKFGIELNIAYMTHPATAEDGILISRQALPKLAFRIYEQRSIEWGKKQFALNLYGDEQVYKPFPDIGSVVREDGILMALRSYDPPELAIVEQSVRDTMEVDTTFDQTVYANGPGGRVVDVQIHHDAQDYNAAPIHMDAQAQKYDRARREFYRRIVDTYNDLNRKQGGTLQITPDFQNLIVKALSVINEGKSAPGGKTQRVIKQHRKVPLDTYRVEITIEYEITPSIGFKLTDCHGGKGVICKIVDESEMPVDEDGNRAEIVMDPNSTINRANPGRKYEQYFNASARDTHKRLCAMLGVAPFTKQHKALQQIEKVAINGVSTIDQAWTYLMRFYEIISPRQRNWFHDRDNKVEGTPAEYLAAIVELGITIFYPTDNDPMPEDIILALEDPANGYRPTYGPVTYVGTSGKLRKTHHPVRIGSVYFIELEKIGDDWGSVSSGKLQHHGVLAQLTRADKYNKPARHQPVRGAGEAEVRIFTAYIGSLFSAEMMDRNNNPHTHRVIVDQLLAAEKPSNIDNLVDRDVYPFGGAKPLVIMNHLLQTSGLRYQFEEYAEVAEHFAAPSYTTNREANADDPREQE